MMTPAEFAEKLRLSVALIEPGLAEGTRATMEVAGHKAKAAIGTYEFGWPQLAEATQYERARKGYPENEPLLREGELRESIETTSRAAPGGAEGLVFSGEKKALWAEIGTIGPGSHSQPPRSFLFKGLLHSIPEAGRIFAGVAERVLAE